MGNKESRLISVSRLWGAVAVAIVAALALVGGLAYEAGALPGQPGLTLRTGQNYRTFDSRINPGSKLSWHDLQGVDVKFSTDGLQFITDESLSGLQAVSFNITITETEGAGWVQLIGPFTELGTTSNINWTGPGQTIANSGIQNVGPTFSAGSFSELGIYVGGLENAKAHVIIDITGVFGNY